MSDGFWSFSGAVVDCTMGRTTNTQKYHRFHGWNDGWKKSQFQVLPSQLTKPRKHILGLVSKWILQIQQSGFLNTQSWLLGYPPVIKHGNGESMCGCFSNKSNKSSRYKGFPSQPRLITGEYVTQHIHSYKPIEAHQMTIKSQFSHHEILLNEITIKSHQITIKSPFNPHEITIIYVHKSISPATRTYFLAPVAPQTRLARTNVTLTVDLRPESSRDRSLPIPMG